MAVADIRWERGRLEYFALPALRSFCKAILRVESRRPANVQAFKARLDQDLRDGRGVVGDRGKLLYPAGKNTAWRNYGRVYRCVYVVFEGQKSLQLTALGQLLLALDTRSVDDRRRFYALLSSRFRWPNPAFVGYTHTADPVYPIQVLIKLLLAGPRGGLALEDLARFVWWCLRPPNAVQVSGVEPPRRIWRAFEAFTARAAPNPSADAVREFREMVSFFSEPGGVFDDSRGSVRLQPRLAQDPSWTLSQFCDSPLNRIPPDADRETEVAARGSLVGIAGPIAGRAGVAGAAFHTRDPRPPGKKRRGRRGRGRRGEPRAVSYEINTLNQLEAEQRVKTQLMAACGAAHVTWFARSQMENTRYDRLDAPGADGRTTKQTAGVPMGYHEVKSRTGSNRGFSFTRNEIQRILECSRRKRKMGYHVWEVRFPRRGAPVLTLIKNVERQFGVGSDRFNAALALFKKDSMAQECQLVF